MKYSTYLPPQTHLSPLPVASVLDHVTSHTGRFRKTLLFSRNAIFPESPFLPEACWQLLYFSLASIEGCTKGNRWAFHMPVQRWEGEQLKGKTTSYHVTSPSGSDEGCGSARFQVRRWKAQVLSWLPAPEAHLPDCLHGGGSGAHTGLTAWLPPNT